MVVLALTYASRPAPREALMAGITAGCRQHTVRLPVCDRTLVSERTRGGRAIAIVCTNIPPIETPTTWADAMPRWSRRPKASPARSAMRYGTRTRPPAKALTRVDRLTRPGARLE